MKMGNIKVYRSQIVKDIESFYGELLYKFDSRMSICSHLKKLSKRLWEGITLKHPVIEFEINNYHPNYLGLHGNVFLKNHLKKKDARLTVAREYGFEKWKDVKHLGKKKYDPVFEHAIEHLLSGERDELEELLKQDHHLIKQRSRYGHKATLLHYTASNGIEMWRQRVPENLPEITQCLLDYGADKNAKMHVYGGDFDTLSLLESSAHPFDAGVGERMLELLK